MAERIIVTDTELKSEEIGKVKLDYSFYPGEDFYSDGQVEEDVIRRVSMAQVRWSMRRKSASEKTGRCSTICPPFGRISWTGFP